MMNAHDVLMYGHNWVHKHLDGLSEEQCLIGGVCGVWSTKEIIAHLSSFEGMLAEVFGSCLGPVMTPTLNLYTSMDGDSFNAVQVDLRKDKSVAAVVEEYDEAYKKVMELLPRLEATLLREAGTLPWYGNEYSLDDFIVYQYYGHKREHCDQIAIFRDELMREGKLLT
jgi:hypothetical protein